MEVENATKTLEDGTVVEIEGIPIYKCTSCGRTQMNLRVRTVIQNEIQRYIDERVVPGKRAQVIITLRKLDGPTAVRIPEASESYELALPE